MRDFPPIGWTAEVVTEDEKDIIKAIRHLDIDATDLLTLIGFLGLRYSVLTKGELNSLGREILNLRLRKIDEMRRTDKDTKNKLSDRIRVNWNDLTPFYTNALNIMERLKAKCNGNLDEFYAKYDAVINSTELSDKIEQHEEKRKNFARVLIERL